MDKGPKQSGTATMTQSSTPWNAQYLTSLFDKASQTYADNPAPNPALTQGYKDLIANAGPGSPAAGTVNNAILPQANNLFGWGANGDFGVQNSPAYGYLNKTLNGDFLNSNPYLDKMFGAASDAVTRRFQTAVDPGIDSNFEAEGRYGSGLMANAKSQARLDLGTTLDNLASTIYGGNYQNERGLQNAAAATTQTGYDTGTLRDVQTLGLAPALVGANFTGASYPAQQEIAGGQGLTGANWTPLQLLAAITGQPITGTTTTQQPIYGPSGGSSAIGGLSGLLGLGKGILGLF